MVIRLKQFYKCIIKIYLLSIDIISVAVDWEIMRHCGCINFCPRLINWFELGELRMSASLFKSGWTLKPFGEFILRRWESSWISSINSFVTDCKLAHEFPSDNDFESYHINGSNQLKKKKKKKS
jgi:hypothetical protein